MSGEGGEWLDSPTGPIDLTEAAPPPAPEARSAYPALGGRYLLEQRIARGGMGEVWRATDAVLGRPVAIKVLRPEYADEEIFLERFRAEARNTAALVHTGIAQVYDFGQARAGGAYVPFIVMELVPGEPLSHIIEREGALEIDRALDLVAQAARALQAAHEGGVIHRDVKPANLLITPAWAVKVTDFGIARAGDALPLTRSGTVMGTAHYLAPEMVSTKGAASPSSDVYALGVVLYECLAGRRPFIGDNPLTVAMAHLHEQPPPIPGLPDGVRALLACVLSKDPLNRPENAADLARRLTALRVDLAVASVDPEATLALGERPSVAPPSMSTAPAPRWNRGATGTRRRGGTPPHNILVPESLAGGPPGPGAPVPDPSMSDALAAVAAGGWAADAPTPPAGALHPSPVHPSPLAVPVGRAASRRRQRPPLLRRPTVLASAAGVAVGAIGVLWWVDSRPSVVEVPAVAGNAEYAATKALERSGFGIKVLREVNRTVPAGVVLMQSPQAGTRLSTDADVSILVSSGPPKVRVDLADWAGRTYLDVRNGLEGRGLKVVDRRVVGAGVPGTVTDVTPQGLVPVGDSVTVTVAVSGPTTTASRTNHVQGLGASAAQPRANASGTDASGTSSVTDGKGRVRP